MRKLLYLVILLLAACATRVDPNVTDYQVWRTQGLERVRNNEMSLSTYYSGLYDRVSTLPNSPRKLPEMKYAAEMLIYAKQLERREITADRFNDFYRLRTAQFADEVQQRQDAADERAASMIRAISDGYRAGRQPAPSVGNSTAVSVPTQVDCTSSRTGTVVRTSCTGN